MTAYPRKPPPLRFHGFRLEAQSHVDEHDEEACTMAEIHVIVERLSAGEPSRLESVLVGWLDEAHEAVRKFKPFIPYLIAVERAQNLYPGDNFIGCQDIYAEFVAPKFFFGSHAIRSVRDLRRVIAWIERFIAWAKHIERNNP